ncbi:LLM class flavin-dependent oxidoreductase [Pseudomonas sp. 21LCFQ02]|uniref:LLM class flavin-dependent oxidoreductase n=1 Tax=Pseudomonas sp. 21LCFQ02 TaxID=2957505 RepID=UPI00209AC5CA|nr:LLM class flavin-dependent oxidoreductase [Pseudomonas sp. 21LCFQ02]MCO8167512.1 LLM class flavin-dependent oxidoreductase [Pseudomonas sp. 21LCFQ02]
MSGQLRLGLFLQETGHHIAGWREPSSAANAARDFRHQIELAQLAEAACFDLVFIQDSYAMRGANDVDAFQHSARAIHWDPLTALSALAMVTERIGLIGTATTTYNEPYTLARSFASLDHISQGRAGWNLVTSNNEAEALNFSRTEHAVHGDRYARAAEFLEVVKGLWDTWEDDAFLDDKQAGQFFDPAKLHVLDHHGENFVVKGPLTQARPPQGYPVLVQAGSSDTGKQLGASTADVIFTAQQNLEGAQRFYSDMKRLAREAGRDPAQLLIMPGLLPVVAATEAEAQAKFDALQELVLPKVGLATLATTLGEVDLSGYDLDGPLPDLPEANGPKSRRQLLIEMARRDNLTIRQLYQRVVGARGHLTVIGTPTQVADVMQQWLEEGGADGFNIMPGHLPVGLRDFTDLVVPELQRRGLFRRQYSGSTLREHLGLARPVNRHVR